MPTQIRIAIEKDVIERVRRDANNALHQKTPYGRSVAWLHGEYRRLKVLEKSLTIPDKSTQETE